MQIGLGLSVVLLAAVGYEGFLRRHGPVRARRTGHLITVSAGAPKRHDRTSPGAVRGRCTFPRYGL